MCLKKGVMALWLIAGIFVAGCGSDKTPPAKAVGAADPVAAAPASGLQTDVVCGMSVDPRASGTVTAEHEGRTYYFCSEMCRKSFEADPEKYAHHAGNPDAHGMPAP